MSYNRETKFKDTCRLLNKILDQQRDDTIEFKLDPSE